MTNFIYLLSQLQSKVFQILQFYLTKTLTNTGLGIFLQVSFEIFLLTAALSRSCNAVLPFGPFFPDFGPDPDFFQEIGPEMVRICIKKSGFGQKMMKLR